MKIYFGADHAGFAFKERMKAFFESKKIKYTDLGAFSLENNDDYPDFAFKVARKVAREKNSRGILFCGTGAGMIIAANKVKGVRAVEAQDKYTAKMSREHNDSNVIGVGARVISFRRAKKIILLWLRTEFSKEERHMRRIKKISEYEK